MAKFVFSNFAVSTLSVAISDTDSALQMNVDDVAKFPSLTGGAKFPLVLADSDDNVEIVYVSALSPSGAATIERGAEGTIAQSWLAGTLLRHTFTAATIIGAAGFNPRGTWLATSSYSPGDVVTNLNISYLAVIQNINSVPSGSNPNWQVIYLPPGTSSTALNAVGRWNSSTTYAAGSVVEFNGIEWYSNANGNLNHAPAYGSTFWTHFSPWSGAAKFVAVLAFAGTNNYTVTIAGTEAPTSLYDGLTIRGRFANTNTSNATLAINALAATALRPSTGVDFQAGGINPGELYEFTYVSATNEFVALRAPAVNSILPGMMFDWAGVAAPTGYLLCFGQAVSRTTYAALFAAIGTAFGAGDGTTTFNLPDFRGRVAVGLDNMGGVAAGRMAGFTTMGALGGVQSVTLATSELPSHNHGVTDPTHTHAVADPGHIHNISDPNHQHSFSYLGVNSGLTFTSAGAGNTEVAGANSGTTNFAATGISVLSGVTGIALFSTFTGISVNNAGGGQAHTNVQPSMAVNKIIKT